MKILVVEDNFERIKRFKRELIGNEVDYAITAEAGIKFVKENVYDLIFLDHDLGDRQYVVSQDPNTGFQVAKVLKGTKNIDAIIVVHSCNPVGASNIQNELGGSENLNCVKIQFPVLNISKVLDYINSTRDENESGKDRNTNESS